MENNNQYPVLQEVYKGAAMGAAAIDRLLPLVKNARFRSDLQTQRKQYDGAQQRAEELMKPLAKCPQELSKGERAMLCACLGVKTLCNRETSHLAQLMIQGSNMGVLNLTKLLNSCGDYEPDPAADGAAASPQPQTDPAAALARSVIRMEEDNIDRLKVYLS
ncbi:MAG: hypothetical protein LUF84_04505 [Clostridiales bacterium]|nr:hypothetical protein [Clostridiales bacterium]